MNSINKNLYKLLLCIVKYTPIILMVGHIISLYLNYIGIKSLFISGLFGTSGMFITLLWILSYVFRFCGLYRIPLQYSTIMTLLFLLRSYGFIPISIANLFRLYAYVSGLFVILFIIFVYKNRNKPKIDYIKQLCDNCC